MTKQEKKALRRAIQIQIDGCRVVEKTCQDEVDRWSKHKKVTRLDREKLEKELSRIA